MKPRIPPSELDKRITFVRAVAVDDGTAKVPGEPAPIGSRSAKKTDIGDSERLSAGENATNLTSRFLVRADSLTQSIGGKDTIEYGGRSYTIVGVKDSAKYLDVIEITTASRSDQS